MTPTPTTMLISTADMTCQVYRGEPQTRTKCRVFNQPHQHFAYTVYSIDSGRGVQDQHPLREVCHHLPLPSSGEKALL